MIRRNASNEPYLRDQYTNAYKHDTGNQYRVDSRTESVTGTVSSNQMKILQVSEDLTIQLNFKGGMSSASKSDENSRMDKQIQVRHGEHVEIKQHRNRHNEYNDRRY